jgi:hypothetical protein
MPPEINLTQLSNMELEVYEAALVVLHYTTLRICHEPGELVRGRFNAPQWIYAIDDTIVAVRKEREKRAGDGRR